jgi:hypothetical protein
MLQASLGCGVGNAKDAMKRKAFVFFAFKSEARTFSHPQKKKEKHFCLSSFKLAARSYQLAASLPVS